jgi:membrane-associated phospholipid phosphatase
LRRSSAVRAAAWATVVVGATAPLARKRVRAPAVLVQAVAFAAPVGLCVAVRRSRARDVATCCLQMWAYVAAYKHPHDDPEAQRTDTHFRYPIVADRVLGGGELPTVRLQRALARVGPDGAEWSPLDKALVWAHWSWFLVPHGSIAYLLLRHPKRFPRAAALMYSVFDLGASFYWVLPTAPPWYAALEAEGEHGAGVPWVRPAGPERIDTDAAAAFAPGDVRAVRRMMVEYGELFWQDGWGPLYSVFGGNPLAAMPSLHFATSLMAALLLAEVGVLPGAFGFAYVIVLGFALVYLGEHYLVDLVGGAVLTAGVKRLEPCAGPLVARLGRAVARLEAIAHASA